MDHADIFDDLAQIQRQFHHLLRTVPGSGLIAHPADDAALNEVLEMGCWTPRETFVENGENAEWSVRKATADGSAFTVCHQSEPQGRVEWGQSGRHNIANALAAIAAARHAGIPPALAIEALSRFQGVKRRMELRGEVGGIRVYDDFAHHPTAIRSTLEGLRAQTDGSRILAILEPRSNTMRMGLHKEQLAEALVLADRVLVHAPPELAWDAGTALAELGERVGVYTQVSQIVEQAVAEAAPGDRILVMSNGGFEGIHQRLLDALELQKGGAS